MNVIKNMDLDRKYSDCDFNSFLQECLQAVKMSYYNYKSYYDCQDGSLRGL